MTLYRMSTNVPDLIVGRGRRASACHETPEAVGAPVTGSRDGCCATSSTNDYVRRTRGSMRLYSSPPPPSATSSSVEEGAPAPVTRPRKRSALLSPGLVTVAAQPPRPASSGQAYPWVA